MTARSLLTPSSCTPVLTARLRLEALTADDTGFLLRVLNDPGFLAHIGDRGVRDEAQALHYLRQGPFCGWAPNGLGLRKVVLKASGEGVGLCGLLQRDTLPGPDLGYALLRGHTGQGYALEAAGAMLDVARADATMNRVLAIVKPANARSLHLLQRLGFRRCGSVPSPSGDASAPPLDLLEWWARPAAAT